MIENSDFSKKLNKFFEKKKNELKLFKLLLDN